MSEMKFQSEITCDYMITSLQAAIDGLGITLGAPASSVPILPPGV